MIPFSVLISELLGNGTPKAQYENLLQLIEENKRLKLKAQFDTSLLEQGHYYRINGTKQILQWEDGIFVKPVKDAQKRFGTWVVKPQSQPLVKSVEEVKLEDLYA